MSDHVPDVNPSVLRQAFEKLAPDSDLSHMSADDGVASAQTSAGDTDDGSTPPQGATPDSDVASAALSTKPAQGAPGGGGGSW